MLAAKDDSQSTRSGAISGFVKPGFEAVREAFVENFVRRNELGAACCIYHRGEKVVDLWGGVRNEATGEPWEEDTMVIVFSTTKGLSGLAMALAHSRGLFEYDERVSKYWPEFAQQVRTGSLSGNCWRTRPGFMHSMSWATGASSQTQIGWRRCWRGQKPAHEPGMRQVYHGMTLGYYESQILRRVDPKHRSIGQYFQDEIATPLGLDFYIRLPEDIPNSRLATLRQNKFGLSEIFAVPFPLFLAGMNPRSALHRVLAGSLFPLDKDRVYARNFEVPAGGGVGTARAIAHAYGVFATGGKELGLREETLRQLMAPPVAPLKGFRDGALKVEVPFSLGFGKPHPKHPFGSPASFGVPGTGGSFGFADPQAGIGFAYVLNGMGWHLEDPRQLSLREAMYRSIGEKAAGGAQAD